MTQSDDAVTIGVWWDDRPGNPTRLILRPVQSVPDTKLASLAAHAHANRDPQDATLVMWIQSTSSVDVFTTANWGLELPDWLMDALREVFGDVELSDAAT